MGDDIDTRHDTRDDEPPFPHKVTVAGIAWIVFGGLIVVNLLIALVLLAAVSGGDRDRASETFAAGLCMSVLLGLFAAGFIFVGVQSVRGTAPGTIGNGVGSIVFGLLNFGPLVALLIQANTPGRFSPTPIQYIQAGVSAIFAAALMVVGILAIVAAPEYKIWRQFQKARERWEYDEAYRRGRRRRAEPDDQYDEDDRPPRRRADGDDDRIRRPPRRSPDEDR